MKKNRIIFYILVLIFFPLYTYAEFNNTALIDLKNSGDFIAGFTIDDCIAADSEAPLNYILGDLNSSSEKVKIYYQHIISNPKNPTLVFLTGGPGGHSIGESDDFEDLSTLFNILYLDPRGFGCSFLGTSYMGY